MFRSLLIGVLVVGATPDVTREGGEIALGAPDPLVVEAQQVLEKVQIKRQVEGMVKRKQIRAEELPAPATFPKGTVQVELSDARVKVADHLSAKVSWSMNVPPQADSQFVYHMQLAHFVGERYAHGHGKWGVAMAQFNDTSYGAVVRTETSRPGEYRILGILSAWSIKTEETYILDVAEKVCVVSK